MLCMVSRGVRQFRGISKFVNHKAEPDLFQKKVHIKTANGKTAEVNVVFQDTKPEGSPIGTLVAVHGAPGSHKDFKYLWPILEEKGVRVVGVNWPGMGYTSYHKHLNHDNDERVQLVQHLVEELKLHDNTVFMGHSRGSENALKMAALFRDHCAGCILVTPIGLRPNRAVQPFNFLCAVGSLYRKMTFAHSVFNPFLHWYYHNVVGLKTPDGVSAGVALSLMRNSDFAAQLKYIEQINDSKVKVLTCFSGNDYLVEQHISEEFAAKFKDSEHFVCTSEDDHSEATSHMRKAFASGKTKVSVLFKPDGHFVQKTRAEFLADVVMAMLESNNKQK